MAHTALQVSIILKGQVVLKLTAADRIHEYNTSFLLTTFLPYHTLPVFKTLLSILPSNIPPPYKFLHPYIRSLTQPPRHVIVYTTTNNPAFASLLNSYVLRVSNKRQQYPALLSFWAGVMTEAVGGMLEKSRSGRQSVQMQNEQDVILRLLPTLNEGLAMKKVPELRIGCYMLLSIMASKGGLEDKLLNVMMEAVVLGWTSTTFMPGLVCLSILAQHRAAKQITKRLTKELLKVPGLSDLLVEISKQRRIDKLANGLCLALINRLSKNGDASVLSIVEPVVQNELLNDAQTTVVVKSLLLAAYRLDDSVDIDGSARKHLAKSLTSLIELPGNPGLIVRGAIEDTSIDMDELELKLQAVIRPKDLLAPAPEDSVMQDTDQDDAVERSTFESLFSALPTRTVDETSFLCHSKSHIYHQLCQAFIVSVARTEDIERFENAPILQRDDAVTATLHFSFFMRVWSSPYPVLARVAALQAVTQQLKSIKSSAVDFQALIPYVIVALGDSSTKARGAAADLIVAIGKLYPVNENLKKNQTKMRQWAVDDLYGKGKEKKEVHWLTTDHAARFLRDILIPTLEECVLDKGHVDSVIENALNSPKSSSETLKRSDSARLSQTLRASILSFLGSNVIYTPLYLVKMRLLGGLNRVRGVASTTRTRVLLPELQRWASLGLTDALQHCKDAQIEIEEFDNQVVAIVVANDAEGLDYLGRICRSEVSSDRPTLLTASFRRIQKIWPSLKGDLRVKTAQLLLDVSQAAAGETDHGSIAQGEAMDLLRTVPLSTDILLSFLNQLPTATKLADKPPTTKRRRTSHGEVARASLQDSKQLTSAIQKVTFVLQLIDSSNPKEHLSLLAGLFNTLAELQHFKIQVGSELGYLQGLVLSSLLAVMGAYKADRNLKLNRTAVRADLLVDCVQKTTSPQVQNAALLMIASLSETAPELVLHSVMPIFTFMGSSVLQQNDDYSAYVTSQTINKVIPPLIASLRKEKGSPVTGAAELLLSFVAAYEHVPAHRRKGLFSSLVRTLGPEDFLFALLAMLADKYGVTDDIKAFAVDLSGAFTVGIQLQTVSKYLDLVSDILKPKPTISSMLLSTSDSTVKDPNRVALNQLILLPHLLAQRKLIDQVGKLLERDDMDSSRIRDLYSALLENLLALADSVKDGKRLHSACGDVLESLLGLLSTSEFVKAVESLLDRPNDDLRRKVLRSIEVRIDQENQSNAQSRLAMLNFLPQLTAIIRESSDILYKHTAVACVDKISEKYGKKDLEAVAAAAQTIASEHCLGQEDARLRVMALLCLASLVEILREGIVPVLPVAITKALEYIEESLEEDEEDLRLHNAAYAFISALVHRLPYMISGQYLDKLLLTSYDSAETELDEESDESRIQCLQLAAKQVDAKNMFGALAHSWDNAAQSGSLVGWPHSIHKHPVVYC
jgi:U3 small nucleolar RNA-associated protein 10